MTGTTQYILNLIKARVWSGFYSPEEVDSMIDDVLEEDADEDFLRAEVPVEFQKKAEAERHWPPVTDCDCLDAAFRALDAQGVLALQNAGYTQSDGHTDAFEALSCAERGRYTGYCFYHGQDLERAVAGGGLMIAFNNVDGDGDPAAKTEVGRLVKEALEQAGLKCDWAGDPEKRIEIPHFDWKRRQGAGE
jgi:hypothetical protein